MKKSTSEDLMRIHQSTVAQYPNRSLENFGLIFVKDRWICGLIVNGVRYAGEGDTPYDAHYALQIDLEKHFERLDRGMKGEDDDSNPDRDSSSSNDVASLPGP